MAVLNGAGFNPSGLGEPGTPAGGVLGAQAKAQYAALARMRWQMFKHSMRFGKGALELGARTFSVIVYFCIGMFLAGVTGVAAYLLASGEQFRFLPILFWVLCFIWQMVPVFLASFQEQFDLSILLRFPVRFGSYFLLYLIFGLADVSSILGGLCCIGIWVGITVARPELFVWTALALAAFAAFNVLLVRAVFAWIDRWLAQRRTREILGAIFMVAILSMQLFNPALYEKRHDRREDAMAQAQELRQSKAALQAKYAPWLHTARAVQQWLPPGLAAGALGQAAGQKPLPALGYLGALGMFTLAVGGVLALRLKAEYRGENLGQAPRRKKAGSSATRAPSNAASLARRNDSLLPRGSGPIIAVMEKEMRAMLRTLPVLYAVGAPLLMVLVFSTLFLKTGNVPGGHVFPMALPICMVYAQLGFTQLFYNNMGAEGAGIQLYFLSPTPIRSVMLAKNLFHSILFVLVAAVAATLTILRLGIPELSMAAATAAWLLFSLPMNLTAGNIFSLRMPYRVNPGRISRQRGSQTNALLSLLVQVVVMAVGAAVFWLGWYLDRQWLTTAILLALAAAAVAIWLRVLGNMDLTANANRDSLVAIVMKTD